MFKFRKVYHIKRISMVPYRIQDPNPTPGTEEYLKILFTFIILAHNLKALPLYSRLHSNSLVWHFSSVKTFKQNFLPFPSQTLTKNISHCDPPLCFCLKLMCLKSSPLLNSPQPIHFYDPDQVGFLCENITDLSG